MCVYVCSVHMYVNEDWALYKSNPSLAGNIFVQGLLIVHFRIAHRQRANPVHASKLRKRKHIIADG